MSGWKLQNGQVSDEEPPSKRREAERLVDETLEGVEQAVDGEVAGITVRRKVKALVVKGGDQPAPVVPDMGHLK